MGMFSRGRRYVGAEEVEEDELIEREDAAAGDKVGGAVYPKYKVIEAQKRQNLKRLGYGS